MKPSRPFLLVLIMMLLSVPIVAGEIPFTLEKGFILISGKASNGEPIQAVLMTGSTYSYFNHGLLKRLKVDLNSTNDLQTGVSKEDAIQYASIPGVTFADERPAEVKMRQTSFDAIEKTLGHKVDVMLGLDYLDGRIVQIDFKDRLLKFLDRPPFDYEAAKPDGKPGSVQIAMRMQEHLRTILGDQVSMPIVEDVKLNGASVRALFNTGEAYPVTIAPFAAKRNSFGPEPEKNGVSKTQLKSIDLGGYQMADVPALIKSNWEDTETRYAASIGLGVMQNFVVTFDWKNKWVALQR
jgi:hypothetical protein